jgi:phage protein D/phage baseplate assembly protein gpV
MPKYLTQCFVKIGGQNVPQDFVDAMDEVVVDTSLHLPGMFTILLRDYELKWVDSSLLDIGKEVEISIKTGDELGGLSGQLITGEITALEPDFSAEGETHLLVRGYDKSHRLHRDRKTRTFQQVSDSDLASRIANEVGLTPTVDTTSVTYPYVLQNNQTNMEFLLARAERIGYQVYAADGKLHFKKGEASQGEGPEIAYKEALSSFRPRLTAAHQANSVTVKGWDPKGKQAITGQATPSSSLNQGGMTQTGGAKTQGAFGSATEVVVALPVATADEANALATGLSNDIGREFVQAEGVCSGDPRVKAGWTIKITGLGTRFSGKYFVTSATHVLNADSFETSFTISGRQPNTISHLLDSGNGHGQSRGLVQGVVPAMVTNLNDPDKLGRVKIKYAWLGEIESDWVRIAAPMAGAQRGFYYLPEVNDEVLVAFEHGDVHRPYIIGVLWNSQDKPPEGTADAVGSDGKVNQRVLKTRQGHLIILDDKQGEEQINVKSKSGHTVILDDKSGSEKITIRDKTGNNEMVIDSTANSMTIKVNGDFTVDAKGKITLQSAQDMTLDSKAKGNFSAMGPMNIESKAPTALKGVKLDINGNSMVSINGGPMVQVQGGIIKLN